MAMKIQTTHVLILFFGKEQEFLIHQTKVIAQSFLSSYQNYSENNDTKESLIKKFEDYVTSLSKNQKMMQTVQERFRSKRLDIINSWLNLLFAKPYAVIFDSLRNKLPTRSKKRKRIIYPKKIANSTGVFTMKNNFRFKFAIIFL